MNTHSRSAWLIALAWITLSSGTAIASSWTDDNAWGPENSYYHSQNAPQPHSSTREYAPRKKKVAALAPFSAESNNLALELGQVFLIGNLGSYSDSLGMQAHYTYGVSSLFAFDTSLGHSSHSDGKLSMTTLLGGMRMNLMNFDRIIPYVNAGAGFYHPSEQLNPAISVAQTNFGIHFGGGVDLQISREMYFGASLAFHNIFGTNQETAQGPINLGGSYMNFMAAAGYTF